MKFANTAEVADLYEKWGSDFYSEQITQTAHGVQCAQLAEERGASSALVLAALLHDIGHLIDLEANSGTGIFTHDTEHEASGARSLSALFPPSVTGPIALHVAAKRYLCKQVDGYFEGLSAASVHSLKMQGGPMSAEEADRFERMSHFESAIELRYLDDLGKDTEKEQLPIAEFHRLLSHHSSQL